MTEVTDKMVEAACDDWGFPRPFHADAIKWMRAAIEAALAAREPVDAGELVKTLRGQVMIDFGLSYLGNASADTIEVLVEALKLFARIQSSSLYSPDGADNEGYSVYLATRSTAVDFTGKDLAHLRALLARIGVKP